MVPSFNKYNARRALAPSSRMLPSVIGGPGGCLGAMLIERR